MNTEKASRRGSRDDRQRITRIGDSRGQPLRSARDADEKTIWLVLFHCYEVAQVRARGSRCVSPGASCSLRHCGYSPISMHNGSNKGFGEGDAEPAPPLKEVYLLKELVGGSFTIHIKRKVVRKCQVADLGAPVTPW